MRVETGCDTGVIEGASSISALNALGGRLGTYEWDGNELQNAWPNAALPSS
jgi:hypothetical protein